jgi:mono/diheme cytochrome c family protein
MRFRSFVLSAGWTWLAVPVTAWFGCAVQPGNGNQNNGNDGAVSFSRDLVPLFQANCAGCHDPGGSSGIILRLSQAESYNFLVNQNSVQAPQLVYVTPFDPQDSLLYLKVSLSNPPVGDRMPQFSPPLTSAQIAMIENWIAAGAPNN